MDTGKAVVLVALIIGAVVLGIFLINRCDGQTVGTSLPKLVASAAAEEEVETSAPPLCKKGKCPPCEDCCTGGRRWSPEKEACLCLAGFYFSKGQQKCVPYQAAASTTTKKVEEPAGVTVIKTVYACPPPNNKVVVDDPDKCPSPPQEKKDPSWTECEHTVEPDGTEILMCQGSDGT